MGLTGIIVKDVITIKSKLSNSRISMQKMQEQTLRKLLHSASQTDFGKHYKFESILRAANVVEEYQRKVPLFDYDKIHKEWWHRLLNGDKNVTWPGEIRNLALSSGTTGSSSKYIPVSKDMILSMRRAAYKQFSRLSDFGLPASFFEKDMLLLGGCTQLEQIGRISVGDLSGILGNNVPHWVSKFYKPGVRISKEKDWNTKLDMITREAHTWDVGIITGVPAWVQILIERIINYYKVKSIHEIWPNFKIYMHGGVSFQPYKDYFRSLLGEDIIYLETYLASEGFLAYQKYNGREAMTLVMKNGIFYEFIPFNSANFSPEGELLENAMALGLSKIKENEEYAIVLSTNAGAWRYLIGDTIRFTDLSEQELVITGRIKHFLSLCGEHLSVGNMNDAISQLNKEMNLNIKEFTVFGGPVENYFSHTWWIGTDNPGDGTNIKDRLDSILCSLNDDYKTERTAALKEIKVNLISNDLFYKWMKINNKLGGSHKFPRVLSNKQIASWRSLLEEQNGAKV